MPVPYLLFDSRHPRANTIPYDERAIQERVSHIEEGYRLIDELMNVKFHDFRDALFRYHFRGLDLLHKDEARARKNIFAALDKIGKLQEKINVRSLVLRTFFDAKYQEIADVFLKDPDREIFARLSKIDPAHQTKYEEASQRPR